MKDERIQTTMNRIATLGFLCICYVLLPLAVLYRMLVLKQQPGEFWDLIAMFFIGMLFLGVAYVRAGFVPLVSRKEWLIIGMVNLVVLVALGFIMGRVHGVADGAATLVGFTLAMALVIGVLHFVRRRWDRREQMEQQKQES